MATGHRRSGALIRRAPALAGIVVAALLAGAVPVATLAVEPDRQAPAADPALASPGPAAVAAVERAKPTAKPKATPRPKASPKPKATPKPTPATSFPAQPAVVSGSSGPPSLTLMLGGSAGAVVLLVLIVVLFSRTGREGLSWSCPGCRSINRPGDRRCYKCRHRAPAADEPIPA